MVSQLGDVTLSAVGMAAQWGWLSNLLGFGLCSGMSVFVAQYWGVKDFKGIRRVLGMGILMALLLTAIFLSVALAAPTFVVSLFNRDPSVVDVGAQYLSIVCFSYPAVTLTNVLATVLRNTERVKLPMYVSAVTTVVNAVVDYGLIFGAFGFPALGVKGAALATCISAWMGPVLILLFSALEKNLLMGKLQELVAFNVSQLASSAAGRCRWCATRGSGPSAHWCSTMIYSNQGYVYYAGMTIFRTFSELAFSFYVGLGNACVIMVGKRHRAGQDPAGPPGRPAVFGAHSPGRAYSSAGSRFCSASPDLPLRHGDNLSAVTIETALAVTIFCSAEVMFRNVSYVQVVGVFRSGGDTLHGMVYDLSCLWLVSVPLTLLAAQVFHLPFLFVVMTAYLGEDIPKAILCLRHFKSLRWLMPVTEEGTHGAGGIPQEPHGGGMISQHRAKGSPVKGSCQPKAD